MADIQTTISPARFRDQTVAFTGLPAGRNIEIPTASPLNYHQVVSRPAEMPRITIDGKLFMPASGDLAINKQLPLVMIVPGSLGVAPSHLAHAETLARAGFATFVLDSFGARGVTSTVANQTQFSFAASAYDVLAAWQVLAALPGIDASRIGAQGHSRGGSAVLTAATRRFADAVIGQDSGLNGVLAAYPWSGHQFCDPSVGATAVRVLMGEPTNGVRRCRCRGNARRSASRAAMSPCGSLRARITASIAAPPSRTSPMHRCRRLPRPPISPTTAPSSTRPGTRPTLPSPTAT